MTKKMKHSKTKLDTTARSKLKITYSALAKAINATGDLESHFLANGDNRHREVMAVVFHLMCAQNILNPLAENDDIRLV